MTQPPAPRWLSHSPMLPFWDTISLYAYPENTRVTCYELPTENEYLWWVICEKQVMQVWVRVIRKWTHGLACLHQQSYVHENSSMLLITFCHDGYGFCICAHDHNCLFLFLLCFVWFVCDPCLFFSFSITSPSPYSSFSCSFTHTIHV